MMATMAVMCELDLVKPHIDASLVSCSLVLWSTASARGQAEAELGAPLRGRAVVAVVVPLQSAIRLCLCLCLEVR